MFNNIKSRSFSHLLMIIFYVAHIRSLSSRHHWLTNTFRLSATSSINLSNETSRLRFRTYQRSMKILSLSLIDILKQRSHMSLFEIVLWADHRSETWWVKTFNIIKPSAKVIIVRFWPRLYHDARSHRSKVDWLCRCTSRRTSSTNCIREWRE